MKLILHVGAGKCGSSSLQSYLTHSPIIKREDGSTAEYMAWNPPKSSLIRGADLRSRAGVYGYKDSAPIQLIQESNVRAIRDHLSSLDTDVILSQEGWVHSPDKVGDILARLGKKATIVLYVRPQVNLLNSAWWQWGAWTDTPFEEWIEQRLKYSYWGKIVQRWSDMKMCSRLIVRPVHGDVVSDFIENVVGGVLSNPPERENGSLPNSLLRLFQRNRKLRPTSGGSAIDFAISRHVRLNEETPWVIAPDMCESIINRTKSDTEKLMSFMDKGMADLVSKDAHWWTAEAFADLQISDPYPQEIPSAKLEAMCVQLAEAVLRLETDLRRGKATAKTAQE